MKIKQNIVNTSSKGQKLRRNSNIYKDSHMQELFDFNKLFQEEKQNESNKSNN